jgi:replicative DNA helicase
MEKYQRRTAIEKMSLSLETACDLSIPMERFLEVASKSLESIYGADGGGDNGFQSMEDCLAEVASSITRAIDGEKSGIPTGVYDLDELLVGGLHPSDMVIVAARPSMGKTAFALHCAATIAKTGLPVGFFSLEMSGAQLALRLLAAESGVESVKLRMGAISDSEVASLTEAMQSLASLPLYICDAPNPNVEQMRLKSKTLMARHGGKLGAIFVDYLQLMDGKGDNRVLELSKITRSLKQLARELQVPVVVLSQLSRGVESRNDKRPGLSDLRDSGSIEQDADIVLFLYREEYYSPETETERGITEAIVRKHRNGPIGTVKMLFDAGRSRFRNAASWE